MIFFPMQIHFELLLQFLTTPPHQCLRETGGILASPSWRSLLPTLALVEWFEPTHVDMIGTPSRSTKQTLGLESRRAHARDRVGTPLRTFDHIRFNGGLATRFASQTCDGLRLNPGHIARPIALAQDAFQTNIINSVFFGGNFGIMARMGLFTGDTVGKVDNDGMTTRFRPTANDFFTILNVHPLAPRRSTAIDERNVGIFDKELVGDIVSVQCHFAILCRGGGGPTEYY
jgi:hypothetical protein